MPWDDPELVHEFLTEAEEHLDEADNLLLDLDGNGPNRAHLTRITGCFHTIKGMSGYVDLQDIQRLCHLTESLLGNLDQAGRVIRQRKLDTTFRVITGMRHRFQEISASLGTGERPPGNRALAQILLELERMTAKTDHRKRA